MLILQIGASDSNICAWRLRLLENLPLFSVEDRVKADEEQHVSLDLSGGYSHKSATKRDGLQLSVESVFSNSYQSVWVRWSSFGPF